MKKFLALVLALVMSLSLVACGSEETTDEGAADGDTAASELNVGVFYYNYSDAYITTVRNAMDALLEEAGITYNNYDGAGNQATQLDQINTAISNGTNLLVVNIVETSSPDAAQQACDAAKNAGIPIVFFNREVENSVVDSYENCAFVGTDAAEAGKPALSFYDANNTSKYLVDTTGNWSSQAATDYMNTVLAAYSEASGNMVELVIANNDGMAEGAIAALQAAGYNTGEEGSTTIPVYGVDAMDSAVQKIENGQMTGTVKQDAEGMASTIMTLVNNINTGAALMDNTSDFVVDSDCAKIRVPYAMVTSEEAAA